MISIELGKEKVILDDSMRSEAIRGHVKSRKVETPEDWKDAKLQAAAIVKWWDEQNGKFKGAWESGYAIHHAQVFPYAGPDEVNKPFSFFVVDKKLTRKSWAKEHAKNDRSIRDITNIIFPAQVIYNPEIVTATQTFMDDAVDKKGERYKKAVANVMRYDEGCMSYTENSRRSKKVSRFYRIKVRYQIVKPALFGLMEKVETVEEWCQGLKAHIFQHEIDHSNGIDIYKGDGDGNHPTIEEREMEDGYTRKQIEEHTAKVIADLEAKIATHGEALLQSVANGRYYRAPLTLDELPEGFIEPALFDLYDHKTGKILPPNDEAPWYDDPSAKEDLSKTVTEEKGV